MTATIGTRDRAQAQGRARYGAYTSGANALAVDYADPLEFDEAYGSVTEAPPRYAPPGRRSAPKPRTRPTVQPAPQVDPAAKPTAAPLPVSLPRAPFLLLILALVIAGVMGVLLLNTKINENSFQLDRLRSQQNELNLQEQQATQRLADKESPGNLAATDGLVPAGAPGVLDISTGRLIGVPGPAQDRPRSTAVDPGR